MAREGYSMGLGTSTSELRERVPTQEGPAQREETGMKREKAFARFKWALLLPVLAVAAAFAITACGGGDESHPVTLNLGTEPRTLDPALATDEISVDIAENIFVALTRVDEATSRIVPYLADGWDVSEGGTVYTFHLRQDATWTDGTPVTAHDIEYGVKRTLDPETASEAAYTLYLIDGAAPYNMGETDDPATVGVTALDDWTLEVKLAEPAAYFPAIAAMWVMMPQPSQAIEEYGDAWTEPENIVTSGPYLLADWDHGTSITLKKNPDFFNAENVQIDEIDLPMIEDESTAMAMYEAGDLDALYLTRVPAEDIDRVKSDPELSQEFTVYPELSTYWYGFNMDKPPFDNALVRKAFAASIDREALVDEVTKGAELPTTVFTAPGDFGAVGPGNGVGIYYDPEQAAAWLAEAGYPNGEGLPEITLWYDSMDLNEKVAQAVQAMWKRNLGVDVKLASQEFASYIDMLVADPPQIFRLGWGSDYADANNWLNDVFNSQSGNNFTHFANARFDELVTTAATDQDPEERIEMYHEAEKILVEDEVALIPLYHSTDPQLTKPYLIRTKAPFGGQQFFNWRLEEA
jgi:oligopeptide transport system substrate-binding protein